MRPWFRISPVPLNQLLAGPRYRSPLPYWVPVSTSWRKPTEHGSFDPDRTEDWVFRSAGCASGRLASYLRVTIAALKRRSQPKFYPWNYSASIAPVLLRFGLNGAGFVTLACDSPVEAVTDITAQPTTGSHMVPTGQQALGQHTGSLRGQQPLGQQTCKSFEQQPFWQQNGASFVQQPPPASGGQQAG